MNLTELKQKLLRGIGLGMGLLVLLALAWVWLTLHWAFSDGERAGYVQKLSRKGWLCKTWEGEMAMVTMPGAIPEKFLFTVPDDVLAGRINNMAGQRVVLTYQQHKFVPSSCFGETEYFVDGVKPVQIPDLAPAVPQGQLVAPK